MIWAISIIILVATTIYLAVMQPKNKKSKQKFSLPVIILSAVTLVWFVIGALVMTTNEKVNVLELNVERGLIAAKLKLLPSDEDVKKAKQFNNELFFTKLKSSYYIFTFDNNEDLNAIESIDID